MFTGLVAELGTVQKLAQQGESYHLTVAAVKVLQNLKIGDSVAVNGACLTVVSMDDTAFTADVMPETVRLTNIGSLHAGDRVNLTTAFCKRSTRRASARCACATVLTVISSADTWKDWV